MLGPHCKLAPPYPDRSGLYTHPPCKLAPRYPDGSGLYSRPSGNIFRTFAFQSIRSFIKTLFNMKFIN